MKINLIVAKNAEWNVLPLRAFNNLDDAKYFANLNARKVAELFPDSTIRIQSEDCEYIVSSCGEEVCTIGIVIIELE